MPFREGHIPLSEEMALCRALTDAIADDRPFALSALGFSGQALLLMPDHLDGSGGSQERAVALTLLEHAQRQSGLFFSQRGELITFSKSFQVSIQSMDGVALAPGKWTGRVLEGLSPTQHVCPLDSLDCRGNRDVHPLQALLNALRGQRVLLVTTPASFLVSRANEGTFEAVWSSVGRPWFDPAEVLALNIPNTYDPSTRARFMDSNNFLSHVLGQIPPDGFDVALIGAALYGPLIAAHVRSLGKVGVSLGSQLQLLFGVYGQRWMQWPDFIAETLNDSWALFPVSYAPPQDSHEGDDRSYWG